MGFIFFHLYVVVCVCVYDVIPVRSIAPSKCTFCNVFWVKIKKPHVGTYQMYMESVVVQEASIFLVKLGWRVWERDRVILNSSHNIFVSFHLFLQHSTRKHFKYFMTHICCHLSPKDSDNIKFTYICQ